MSLTLETEKLSAAKALLQKVAHDSAEIVMRGDESTLHIFAQKGSEPGALLADLRARVGEAGLAPRALALETGRLDDVFGALTGKARPAPPIFSAEKETAS